MNWSRFVKIARLIPQPMEWEKGPSQSAPLCPAAEKRPASRIGQHQPPTREGTEISTVVTAMQRPPRSSSEIVSDSVSTSPSPHSTQLSSSIGSWRSFRVSDVTPMLSRGSLCEPTA
jgi:hypothetical protein